jgi:hypothetical protein
MMLDKWGTKQLPVLVTYIDLNYFLPCEIYKCG